MSGHRGDSEKQEAVLTMEGASELGAGAFHAVLHPGDELRISREPEDARWDAFVAAVPGGHHVQSSAWGLVKATAGWRPVRVVVLREGAIVAGAQILTRPVPVIGSVGYLPSGPCFAEHDETLMGTMTEILRGLARRLRIKALFVQPPATAEAYAEHLAASGFRRSRVGMALTATTVLDLGPDLDDVLAGMKSKTRYNIRLSQRRGIVVREGTESDIPTFHRILAATGERQGFSPNDEAYFTDLTRILRARGHCKLFLAEHEGEAVSCMLAIPFGDTVVYKRGAWAGTHGEKRPNEAMHWAVIRWAKANGYRYYDFDGLEPDVAESILQGQPIPRESVQSVTRFKLGFNGAIVLRPGVYEYVHGPVLRWAYGSVYARAMGSPRMVRLIKDLLR